MRTEIVGRPMPRRDGLLRASGQVVYGVDFKVPGMLWGKIVRGEHPHARILRIDASRALTLPGVKAVVTGREAPDGLFGARLGRADPGQGPSALRGRAGGAGSGGGRGHRQ